MFCIWTFHFLDISSTVSLILVVVIPDGNAWGFRGRGNGFSSSLLIVDIASGACGHVDTVSAEWKSFILTAFVDPSAVVHHQPKLLMLATSTQAQVHRPSCRLDLVHEPQHVLHDALHAVHPYGLRTQRTAHMPCGGSRFYCLLSNPAYAASIIRICRVFQNPPGVSLTPLPSVSFSRLGNAATPPSPYTLPYRVCGRSPSRHQARHRLALAGVR